MLLEADASDSAEADLEWMLAMEEEIVRTLESEERSILAEFYEHEHEEAAAAAASDDVAREQDYQAHLERMGGDESQVVLCPVCQSNYLFAHRSVIFCNCGAMRIDTKGDCVGLPHFKEALGMVHQNHALRGCGAGKLEFRCEQVFGSSTHLMSECRACGFLQVVV